MSGKVYEDRPYQRAIIDRSIEKNSIIYLPTGAGKTFIAVQVMKHFLGNIENKYSDDDGKIVIFMVNTVYLAKQQCEYITAKLPYNVKLLVGEMNIDSWTEDVWEKCLDESQVLVSTADVINTAIDHSFINIEKISLLVFDECHHGRKDHAYAKIMKKIPIRCSTRIVGLSGMLIGIDGKINDVNVKRELEQLEAMFQSTIVAVNSMNDLKHVLDCSTKPVEKYVTFAKCSSVTSIIEVSSILSKLSESLKEIQLQKYVNPKTLRVGVPNKMKDLLKIVEDFNYHSSEMGSFGGYLSLLSSLITLELTKRFSETHKYREIVEACITVVERCKKKLINDLQIEPDNKFEMKTILMNSSTKVQKLINLLYSKFTDPEREADLQAIVFVKRRTTAKIIYHILKAMKFAHQEFPIEPDFVVGVNDDLPESIEAIVNSSFSNIAIAKFKNKETNCIISTSVLEEGIDLQMCNLVIVYDQPFTYREYIQARGRARAQNSNYIPMVEEMNLAKFERNIYKWNAVDLELRNQLLMKSYDRSAPKDEDIENQRKDLWQPFITPISKSLLNGENSVSLLERYSNKLPKDIFTNSNLQWSRTEDDNGGIIAQVRMPLQSKIKGIIQSDPFGHVKIAKRHAAFKACVALYEEGELNDNLVPVDGENKIEQCTDEYFSHWNEYAGDSKKAGTQKNQRCHDIKKPEILKDSNPKIGSNSYIHRLKVRPQFTPTDHSTKVFHEMLGNDRTFGILSSKRLPSLCKIVLFKNFGEVEVEICSPPECYTIKSAEELKRIQNFHVTVFQDILHVWKNFMVLDTSSCLVVPLDEFGINWEIIGSCQRVEQPRRLSYDEIKKTDFSSSAYDKTVVCPIYRNEHTEKETFVVVNFVEYLTPRSKFEHDEINTYQDYYQQKWGVSIVNLDQNLIEVKGISKELKLFFPGGGSKGKKKSYENSQRQEFFVPELCHNFKVPADYFLKASLLPSIFHRMHYLLLAEELRRWLHDENILINFPTSHGRLDVDYADYEKREALTGDDSERNLEIDDNLMKKLVQIIRENDSNPSFGALDVKAKAFLLFEKSELPIDIDRSWLTLKIVDIDYYYNFLNQNRNISNSRGKHESKIAISSPVRNQKYLTDSSNRSRIAILDLNEYSGTVQQKEMIKVLTTSKAGDVFDMERLEVLGDSFLKFAVSFFLYKKHPDWHEGFLTSLKGRIVSNRNFFYIGDKMGLSNMIKTSQFDPKSSYPLGAKIPENVRSYLVDNKHDLFKVYDFEDPTRDQIISGNLTSVFGSLDSQNSSDDQNFESDLLVFINQHKVGDKKIADGVEAFIGCVIDSLGIGAGLKLLLKLKILPSDQQFIDNLLVEKIEPRNVFEDNPKIPNRAILEGKIGYKFNNPIYLIQAITHPSNPVKTFGTYQQLEFVGDAILDFLVTSYIIERCPKMDPGKLTDLRSALVNNATLACIIVRNEIHKFLLSESVLLSEAIGKFVEYQKAQNHKVCLDQIALLDSEQDAATAESVDIPKVIGDLFESIIGAVFLDSGLDFEVTWSVIYRLIKNELHEFMEDVPMQIVRQLYEYDKGNAQPRFYKPFQLDDHKDKVFVGVKIKLNGEDKLFCGSGVNKSLAKKCAAKLALKALTQRL